MLAASDPEIADGLLLLSYPLHPPQRPAQLRTAHFPQLQTPVLFVHGSRDGFATDEELATARSMIPGRAEVLEIAGAGHELLSKRNAQELPIQIVDKFHAFIGT